MLCSEKRNQVNSKPVTHGLHIARAAFASSDDFILQKKLVGCLFESSAGFQIACKTLASECKIPIFGKLFRKGKTVLFGGGPPVLPLKIS